MNKKRWATRGVIVILSLGLIWLIFSQWEKGNPLTQVEAAAKVEELYQGSITNSRVEGDRFIFQMSVEKWQYELAVDSSTGEILSMKQLNESSPLAAVPNTSPPESSEKPATPEEPTKTLTEEEARSIALEKVDGTIDEVELEVEGSGTYYMVDFEDHDGQEGTVQIHAITGEVISVSWDD